MRMMDADIIDGDEPLSKALNSILKTGTAVMVTKKGKYYGLIDDRDIRQVANASRCKAITAAVRAPHLTPDSTLEDAMQAFMAGYFKSVPVVKAGKIIGAVSQADVMNEMAKEKKVPKTTVSALMAVPIYTVDQDEDLGVARTLMKKLGVHHLAVTSRSKVIGTISTFDLSMCLLKPKGRQRFVLISEITNADMKPVKDYMREKMVTTTANESLESAVKKMAKKNVSKLTVVEGGKAIGVLTASDVMKFVLSLVSKGPNVFISGLPEDVMFLYGDIEAHMKDTIGKFTKTFEIGDVHVHFKKGKSTYHMNTRLEIEHENLVVRTEGYDLKTVVSKNINEIKRLLTKRKNYKRDKRKHYMTEGFYERTG